jgi:hypothetical protein
MLTYYRLTANKSITVGLAVEQWFTNNDPRIYILVPQDTEQYCEVDIIYPSDYEWGFLSSTNANIILDSKELDKSELQELDDEINEALYYVWDDGALIHPIFAVKLYEIFEPRINQNRELATRVKEKFFGQEYRAQIDEAKNNGWDINLIQLKKPQQPYGSA